jgi:hypothetical protein
MGAEPIVANGLEADAVRQAVARARPQVIVNQMTALSTDFNARKFDQIFSTTNRLRTEGNDNLLAAAKASGVSSQSPTFRIALAMARRRSFGERCAKGGAVSGLSPTAGFG